jgi:hypothetical protein
MKIIRKIIPAILICVFSGCGSSNNAAPDPSPTLGSSILEKWVSSDPSLNLTIDFSQMNLGNEYSSNSLVVCNGSYDSTSDSTTPVNGVDPGYVLLSGTPESGTLQVGNLEYVGASNPFCQETSKEPYTYQITNGVLSLCSVNYGNCVTFNPNPVQ